MDKTLDEALDEFDRWGEQLSEQLQKMTSEERRLYLENTLQRIKDKTGITLTLRVVSPPKPVASGA